MPDDAKHDQEFVGSQFTLEIGGVELGRFQAVSGLNWETEVIEFKDTTKEGKVIIRKRPGQTKYPDVTFKRGVIHTQTALDWLSSVSRKDPTSRKNITLVLVDEAGARLAGWKLSSAWITKIEGPAFNASANEIAVESLELANEGLALVDDDDTGKRQS